MQDGVDNATFVNICVSEPDGSLDRCGGHFPCAANVAMTAKGHVVYGFNGEGWRGHQANQWLHFDGITGLFLGQFGTVNGISSTEYVSRGYAIPGAAGNAFAGTLVTLPDDGEVYLYHNDESVHGGLHRWHLRDLDSVERVVVPLQHR